MESGSGESACNTGCDEKKVPLWMFYAIGLIIILIISMAVITILLIVRSCRICKKIRISRKTKQQYSVTYYDNMVDPILGELLQQMSNTNSFNRNNSNDQSGVVQTVSLNTEIQDHDSADTANDEEETSNLSPALIGTVVTNQTAVQSNTNEIHVDESLLTPLATKVIRESIYDRLPVTQEETKNQVTATVYSKEKKDESVQYTNTVSLLGSASQECYDDNENDQESYDYDDIDSFVGNSSREDLSDDIDGPARRLPGEENARRSAYYIYIPETGVEGIYTVPDNVERDNEYCPIISEPDPSVRPVDEGIYTLPDLNDPNQWQSSIYNTIDEVEQFPSDKNYSYAEPHMLCTSEEPIGEVRAEGNNKSNLGYDYAAHHKLQSSISSVTVRGIVKAKKESACRMKSANAVGASTDQQKVNDHHYENFNVKDIPKKWDSDLFSTVRAEVSDPSTQSLSHNNTQKLLKSKGHYENTSGINDNDDYFVSSKDWMRTNSLPSGSCQTAVGRLPPPLTDKTPPSSHTYMLIFKRDMYKHDYDLPKEFSLESSASQPTNATDMLGLHKERRRLSYDGKNPKTHKYENQSMWMKGTSKTISPSSMSTYTKIEKQLCEDDGVYMLADTSPVTSPVKTTTDK